MTTALTIAAGIIGYLLAGGLCSGILLRIRRTSDRLKAHTPASLILFSALAWPAYMLAYLGALIVTAGMRVTGVKRSDLGGGE